MCSGSGIVAVDNKIEQAMVCSIIQILVICFICDRLTCVMCLWNLTCPYNSWCLSGGNEGTAAYYIEYSSCSQNVYINYTYLNSSTVKDWVSSLTVIRWVCMHSFVLHFWLHVLYYCNMVVWSWSDWSLIWTTIFILQCCDTVGWVIWLAKTAINSQEMRLAVKTVPEMTDNVSSAMLNFTATVHNCLEIVSVVYEYL